MKYKNIIFDFDGVLTESIHIKTHAFHELYNHYGKEIAEKVVTHHKANGGMSRFEKFPYYHKTFLDIHLSDADVKNLSNQFSSLVIDSVVNADEVPGALWFLKKYQYSCKYWIASATPTDEINEITKRKGMAEYFIKIYGSPENKIEIVKKIMNDNLLTDSKTLFLGDAMSDFKAAQENNIDFMLRKTEENDSVFCGYNGLKCFNDFNELDKILDNK